MQRYKRSRRKLIGGLLEDPDADNKEVKIVVKAQPAVDKILKPTVKKTKPIDMTKLLQIDA